MIEYCLRPIDDKPLTMDFVNTLDENFTFEQLRRLNVTTKQLISWSTTIDLAEKYQYFLDEKTISSALAEIVYFKCRIPWFGSQCQYSFVFDELYPLPGLSLSVSKTFSAKYQYGTRPSVTDRTCYVHLRCDRGGASMCLDWREVCNGRVDCLDGGEDEAQCSQLELNECDENEYRCHNGLCISIDISDSEDYLLDCLDKSRTLISFHSSQCLEDPTFICEEHACRPGSEQFPCGDGQCVEDFAACKNGRHYLLFESMSAQDNLSEECWLAMICLTKMKDHIEKTSCQNFTNSSNLLDSIQSCDFLTQFPTIPVLFDHVRFLYRKIDRQLIDMKVALPPDYICYDEQLCEFLLPTFRDGVNTCRMSHEMGFQSNVKYRTWKSLIDTIKPYFRGCLTTSSRKNNSEYNSLYCCHNSSKCISKHRILDGISDCYLNDDEEEYELSCSMNDTYRWKYPNENVCYSPLIPKVCPSFARPVKLHDILFHQICDRIVHLWPEMINGQNHTDETECHPWECSNIYTRCNLFWNCPDGKDEENCPKPLCPFPYHSCISPQNGTFQCLPLDQIENGIIDCLGGSDELRYCLTMESISKDTSHFHCFNESQCLKSNQICDSTKNCLFHDDERFCEKDMREKCNPYMLINRTNAESALCQLINLKNIQFSLQTTPIYPSHRIRMIDQNDDDRPLQRSILTNEITNQIDDLAWSWRCNRGLYTRLWLGGNIYTFKCFCPPSYYGNLCEYQNERVSLSLKLMTNNWYGIYLIVVTLIDDDDDRREINSYDQIYYVPRDECKLTFNTYLLYLNRPKNRTKKYSIHIDAFDKISLTYLVSWNLNIPFSFLPVNRLSAQLIIPIDRIPFSNKCLRPCQNGQCIKYLNREKFFCQCKPNWSGSRCDIPSNCADCSKDSICIGSIRNRSICVCPMNKFGPRCLLPRPCPTNFCLNNGQCLVTDESTIHNSYNCICPKPFYGNRCEKQPSYELKIALNNLDMARYAVIHFISIINNLPLLQTWKTETLKMFQNVIILRHDGKFNVIIVKHNDNYYLALVQIIEPANFSTSISPNQRCSSINEVLNLTILVMPKIRQVKYYHTICQMHRNLGCFFDEFYLCLCTRERHANCFHFEHNEYSGMSLCPYQFYCLNGGECLQDDPKCPKSTICLCKDCYFGNRCQFYAKGIGLTLDDILRYEIRPNVTLVNQTLSVKVSLTLTMIIFISGLINGFLSLLVFLNKDSQKVGCGIYLLASSITSFLTSITLTMKFWFIVLTHINGFSIRSVLYGGCVFIEGFLKLFLYLDSWLNACVAIERSIAVFKGIKFNAAKSKTIAKFTILFVPFLILGTIIHEFLYRNLFDDSEEERIWCIARYSYFVENYNTIILFFHFLVPFLANFFSALFIICRSSRQRATIRTRQSYKQHLYAQLNDHKHLIISPIILVILSLPRLTISLLSGCTKTSRNPWLYIFGYFISFIPSVSLFVVFVLPSEMYKKLFNESLKNWRRRFH